MFLGVCTTSDQDSQLQDFTDCANMKNRDSKYNNLVLITSVLHTVGIGASGCIFLQSRYVFNLTLMVHVME